MVPYLPAPYKKYVAIFIVGLLTGTLTVIGVFFTHIRTAQGSLRPRGRHVVAEPRVQPLLEREAGVCNEEQAGEILGGALTDPKPKRAEKSFYASVTRYTKEESCFYPKDGGCLTASGRVAKAGSTVACPKSIPLGNYVVIDGHRYRCDDRTADWVQRRYGPTFDIFGGVHADAIRYGRRRLGVTVE